MYRLDSGEAPGTESGAFRYARTYVIIARHTRPQDLTRLPPRDSRPGIYAPPNR